MNTHYAFVIKGDANLFRAMAFLLDEPVDSYLDCDWNKNPEYFKNIPALDYDTRVTAAFTGLEVIGGLSMFIGSCFAKKNFDEVYERTAKRRIANFLDKFFVKGNFQDDAKLEYRDVIYFEDIELVIVIRVLVERNTTTEIEKLLLQAHRIAHTFVEQAGKKAPIHCHLIENGQVNVEPELFNHLEHIERSDTEKFMELIRTRKIVVQDGKLKCSE
jgi:hypothetical protein